MFPSCGGLATLAVAMSTTNLSGGRGHGHTHDHAATHALLTQSSDCYSRCRDEPRASGGVWGTRPVAGERSRRELGFGDVLRRYRVAAGLTQEALAERAALSARGISDLERAARTRPYPATVRRLAEALGLSEADRKVLETAAAPAARVDAGTSRPAAAKIGMLPTPLSSFVGREHQVTEMRRVLAAHRLVTMLGPGGIGKTRLAIEVAAGIVDDFADGVVFVALASVRDPGLVISAVAEALGIQEMGSRPLADRVRSRLQTAQMLVVLDNFEHVLRAAEAVGALLADCPQLRVLVTSRAPLRLSGERAVVGPPTGASGRPRPAATRAALDLRGRAAVHRARLDRAPAVDADCRRRRRRCRSLHSPRWAAAWPWSSPRPVCGCCRHRCF